MRQEARASARVSHPNIVALHDMGQDSELGLYLVFEHIHGITLKERLGRGPLGPEAAARLAREIGDALATAHAAGVVHRDIKPENVILSPTGGKIADFGIARVPDSTLTRDGGLLGTPAYSAPEAIAEARFSPLSDQFSMAATLYEAIAGRRAFPGDDAIAVASRISTDEPPPIAEVCGLDAHVDTVLSRGLSKNPGARFETAADFGRALAEALLLSPRTSMPTLPDSHHRARGGVDADSVGETRSTRIAVGGAAVGALIAIAGLQLSAQLRVDRASTEQSAAVPEVSASVAVGYLAETPRKRKTRSAPREVNETPGFDDSGPAIEPEMLRRDASAVREGARGAADASTSGSNLQRDAAGATKTDASMTGGIQALDPTSRRK
jgi:serine/threonine-protein kinase